VTFHVFLYLFLKKYHFEHACNNEMMLDVENSKSHRIKIKRVCSSQQL